VALSGVSARIFNRSLEALPEHPPQQQPTGSWRVTLRRIGFAHPGGRGRGQPWCRSSERPGN